jgi:hypothetical protein
VSSAPGLRPGFTLGEDGLAVLNVAVVGFPSSLVMSTGSSVRRNGKADEVGPVGEESRAPGAAPALLSLIPAETHPGAAVARPVTEAKREFPRVNSFLIIAIDRSSAWALESRGRRSDGRATPPSNPGPIDYLNRAVAAPAGSPFRPPKGRSSTRNRRPLPAFKAGRRSPRRPARDGSHRRAAAPPETERDAAGDGAGPPGSGLGGARAAPARRGTSCRRRRTDGRPRGPRDLARRPSAAKGLSLVHGRHRHESPRAGPDLSPGVAEPETTLRRGRSRGPRASPLRRRARRPRWAPPSWYTDP